MYEYVDDMCEEDLYIDVICGDVLDVDVWNWKNFVTETFCYWRHFACWRYGRDVLYVDGMFSEDLYVDFICGDVVFCTSDLLKIMC